jgi:hypothetical protein
LAIIQGDINLMGSMPPIPIGRSDLSWAVTFFVLIGYHKADAMRRQLMRARLTKAAHESSVSLWLRGFALDITAPLAPAMSWHQPTRNRGAQTRQSDERGAQTLCVFVALWFRFRYLSATGAGHVVAPPKAKPQSHEDTESPFRS